MSEKKIKDALDAIEPSPGAKERIYENIMKKAAQAAPAEKAAQAAPAEKPAQPKKKTAPFLRYALPIAACFCLLVVGLAKLLPGGAPPQPDGNNVQIPNPFVEVESADDFKALSITLDAPSGAQEVSYFIIDGAMAEVRFALDGKTYQARASAQKGDFSGLNGTESGAETVDAKTDAVLMSVDSGTGVYQKITWTDGKVRYCLAGTDGANREQVLSAYYALKK